MSKIRVDRPVVRSFKIEYAKNAAAWVKRGGHAIVWESKARARLVVSVPEEDDDLGLWAMLDLGKWHWRRVAKGPLRGLAYLTIAPDSQDIVRGWCTRDSIHPGPKRTIAFDCLECGACCRSNEVVLQRKDIKRFKDGGRPELAEMPSARRRKSDGKLVLRLLKSGDCRNLGADNKCAIYTVRPDACSEFPVGSECCLYARQVEMDVIDGARD